MKIIDKLHQKELSYSFEFFPTRNEETKIDLYKKIEYFVKKFNPLFIDVTWGAGGRTSDKTLEIVNHTQNEINIETQMHLTCIDINEEKIKETLDICIKNNIFNILALRGDIPSNETSLNHNFKYSKDLVKYIRLHYKDLFGISVAGYPEGHLNYKEDLIFLKEKVDTGADFIITQLFFDINVFLTFLKDSRDLGITCPIIPGIFPIINYDNFKRIQKLCNVHVPQWISDELEKIKNDKEKVIEFGIQFTTDMCKKLYDKGIYHFHFYTLNTIHSTEQIILNLEKRINEKN